MALTREFKHGPTLRSSIRPISFPEGSRGMPVPGSELVRSAAKEIFAEEGIVIEQDEDRAPPSEEAVLEDVLEQKR